jgi:hypothetical protein
VKQTTVILLFLISFILLQGCASRSKDVNKENTFIENVTTVEPPAEDDKIENAAIEDITIVLSTETTSEPEIKPEPEPTPKLEPTPEVTSTPVQELTPPPAETTPKQQSGSKTLLIEENGYVNRAGVYAYVSSQRGYLTNEYEKNIIDHYFEEAEIEGVNRDIAIAQMLYHTNFFRNRNLMSKYNFARFNQPQSWTGFRNEREGVRAHIQHLKHYSNGSLKYPNDNVDPRYSILRSNNYLGKYLTIQEVPWAGSGSVNQNYIKNVLQHLQRLWEYTDKVK